MTVDSARERGLGRGRGELERGVTRQGEWQIDQACLKRGGALNATWHPGLDPGAEALVKAKQSVELSYWSCGTHVAFLIVTNVAGNER